MRQNSVGLEEPGASSFLPNVGSTSPIPQLAESPDAKGGGAELGQQENLEEKRPAQRVGEVAVFSLCLSPPNNVEEPALACSFTK